MAPDSVIGKNWAELSEAEKASCYQAEYSPVRENGMTNPTGGDFTTLVCLLNTKRGELCEYRTPQMHYPDNALRQYVKHFGRTHGTEARGS